MACLLCSQKERMRKEMTSWIGSQLNPGLVSAVGPHHQGVGGCVRACMRAWTVGCMVDN